MSHYRQPQCVAGVDLWLPLGLGGGKGIKRVGRSSEAAGPHG